MKKLENMTKKDLQTGMVAETRNGDKFIIFTNTARFENGILINANKRKGDFNELDAYSDDLFARAETREEGKPYDIMKIYYPGRMWRLTYADFTATNNLELIWERGIKEVPLKKIEDYFGCKVKIVE